MTDGFGAAPAKAEGALVEVDPGAVRSERRQPEPREPTPLAEWIAELRECAAKGFWFEISGEDAAALADAIEAALPTP